ncbi:MAG TPA: hypothetical protein DD622_01585 [Opitutae bacterium]|nr:hypothetical protein [Opitutae bacterium]
MHIIKCNNFAAISIAINKRLHNSKHQLHVLNVMQSMHTKIQPLRGLGLLTCQISIQVLSFSSCYRKSIVSYTLRISGQFCWLFVIYIDLY